MGGNTGDWDKQTLEHKKDTVAAELGIAAERVIIEKDGKILVDMGIGEQAHQAAEGVKNAVQEAGATAAVMLGYDATLPDGQVIHSKHTYVELDRKDYDGERFNEDAGNIQGAIKKALDNNPPHRPVIIDNSLGAFPPEEGRGTENNQRTDPLAEMLRGPTTDEQAKHYAKRLSEITGVTFKDSGIAFDGQRMLVAEVPGKADALSTEIAGIRDEVLNPTPGSDKKIGQLGSTGGSHHFSDRIVISATQIQENGGDALLNKLDNETTRGKFHAAAVNILGPDNAALYKENTEKSAIPSVKPTAPAEIALRETHVDVGQMMSDQAAADAAARMEAAQAERLAAIKPRAPEVAQPIAAGTEAVESKGPRDVKRGEANGKANIPETKAVGQKSSSGAPLHDQARQELSDLKTTHEALFAQEAAVYAKIEKTENAEEKQRLQENLTKLQEVDKKVTEAENELSSMLRKPQSAEQFTTSFKQFNTKESGQIKALAGDLKEIPGLERVKQLMGGTLAHIENGTNVTPNGPDNGNGKTVGRS